MYSKQKAQIAKLNRTRLFEILKYNLRIFVN